MEFKYLSGIAVDPSDNNYAVDRKYEDSKICVVKFTPDGQFLTQWDFSQKEINETEILNTGIAIDKTGNAYILNGNSVQKFAIGGSSTTTVPVENTKPHASFTVTPFTNVVSKTFSFDASDSIDNESDAKSLAVRWDWEDDGTSDTDYKTNKMATHAYSNEGYYTVRLEVKDPQGLTDTATNKIIVWAQPQLCPASYVMEKNNQQLRTLRKFRDNVLAGSLVGIKIIELYYENGAKIIEILEKNPALKNFTKFALKRIILLIEN